MARTYKRFNLYVTAASGGTSSGVMTLVGSNTQYSLVAANPSRFNAGGTADGVNMDKYQMGYGLNNAYCGGAFVPGFGSYGSWVAASMGGDTAPRIWDATVFDFSTNTWSLQINAHGIKNHVSADHYPLQGSETTWAQPWSTDGKLESTNFPGVPHPTQSYRMNVGVGDKYIMCGSAYPGAGGVGASGWSHQYDPATRSYSLYSTNALTGPRFDWMKEACCLLDANHPSGPRIWLIPHIIYGGTTLPYLPVGSSAAKTWGQITIPPGPIHEDASNWHHALLHDDGTRRCILRFQNNQAANNYAYVIDLNNTGAGWRPCTLSGSLANFGRRSYIQAFGVRWAQYPAADGGDNCHYSHDGYSKVITKITPPTGSIEGVWTISSVTPASYARQSGTSWPLAFPDAEQGTGGAGAGNAALWLPHMTRFFYVPALQCFAWVAAGDGPVALWKP